MRQDLRLYFGDREIEFNNPPKILYNYTETDTTNPTIIKNSFSKTLTIEGTPSNNDLFGHIWDLQRIQMSEVGEYSGSYFEPLQKTPFTLYLNNEVYESGYAKLVEVRKTGNNIEYDITLYGGLGDFFYSLTYAHNEVGELNGPDKLKLTNLGLGDLSFTANKETVKEAWDALKDPNDSSKWQTINFAPAYEGKPSDFDADKVLVNLKGMSTQFGSSRDGYAMGELAEEVTEWEAKDLRSYLQRPVLRVKSILNSIFDPTINGGYKVVTDPTFFNKENPYFENAWFTLPTMKALAEGQNEETEVNDAQIVKGSGNLYDIVLPSSAMKQYTNLNMNLQIGFNAPGHYEDLFTCYRMSVDNKYWLWKNLVKSYSYTSGVLVQLIAYNAYDEVVATSKCYQLVSAYRVGRDDVYYPDFSSTFKGNDKIDVPEFETIGGFFTYDYEQGRYVWKATKGGTGINFSLNGDTPFVKLKLKIKTPYEEFIDYGGLFGGKDHYGTPKDNGSYKLWTKILRTEDGDIFENDARNTNSVQNFTFTPFINGFYLLMKRYEDIFTGTKITTNDVLNFDFSPCDFLLSYCKMFGLHFYKEVDSKTIHILTRTMFYDINNVVDLESKIDRSRQIKITPQVAKTKWYEFNAAQNNGEAADEYYQAYGNEYGSQRINTGYNFDAEKTSLLKDNLFKGAVMVLEKDKYFNAAKNGVQPICCNGMVYKTWNMRSGEVEEKVFPIQAIDKVAINKDGLSDYDSFPKMQFHKAKYEEADGNMVLCFFNGFVNPTDAKGNEVKYWLTDDTDKMTTLNDGTPCWLMTNSETDQKGDLIAYEITNVPVFTRDIEYGSSKSIVHSWNFGKPLYSYVPQTYYAEKSCIYEKYWKSFISDLYSTNNRVMKCYVLIEERPNPDWLRRFYWFDNTIWRLNKISDWDISSYETTACEFVKVQDLSDYQINVDYDTFYFEFERFNGDSDISPNGGEVIGRVRSSHPSSVTASTSFGYFDTSGRYKTSGVAGEEWYFRYVFYENPSVSPRSVTFYGTNSLNNSKQFSVSQLGTGTSTSYIDVNPISMTIAKLGREYEFSVLTNRSWTCIDRPYWITLDKMSGDGDQVVTFTPEDNDTNANRVGILTFATTDGKTATLTITQNYITRVRIERVNGDGAIPVRGGEAIYNVVSDEPWKIEYLSTKSPDFARFDVIEGEPTEGMHISLAFDENDTEVTRNVNFYLTYGGYTRTERTQPKITPTPVLQLGKDTIVETDREEKDILTPTGLHQSWTASTSDEWIILQRTSGTGGIEDIPYEVKENNGNRRIGYIYVNFKEEDIEGNIETRSQTIRIEQEGGRDGLYTDTEVITANASNNGTYFISVHSGKAWNITEAPAWIEIDEVLENGFTFLVEDNNEDYGREGRIVVSNGTESVEIAINQPTTKGSVTDTLEVYPTNIVFTEDGGTATFRIISNSDWTITEINN